MIAWRFEEDRLYGYSVVLASELFSLIYYAALVLVGFVKYIQNVLLYSSSVFECSPDPLTVGLDALPSAITSCAL